MKARLPLPDFLLNTLTPKQIRVLAKYHAKLEAAWDAELREANETAVLERMLKVTRDSEVPPMTWAEFKAAVEAAGVRDDS